MSTKSCPECGGTALVRFMSLNYKRCGDCGEEMPWTLDPGQPPLVANNRVRNPKDDSDIVHGSGGVSRPAVPE